MAYTGPDAGGIGAHPRGLLRVGLVKLGLSQKGTGSSPTFIVIILSADFVPVFVFSIGNIGPLGPEVLTASCTLIIKLYIPRGTVESSNDKAPEYSPILK
jgi:hypothetical protein